MKVLNLSLALWLLSSSLLLSREKSSNLDEYISEYKKEQFKYDYQKNEAEASKLHDSWIAPLQVTYTNSRSKPGDKELSNENAAIKMDQPIFQSGGIYYGIKFANASKLYSNYSIDVAKKKMIKETVATLMQIKQSKLREEAQKLKIKNSQMNLEQKKEQYLSGQLDSGFLDDAIIQRNIVVQALYDIQTTKEKLINKFNSLSDLDYKNTSIPHLELLDKENFLKYNIVLKQNEAEIEKTKYYKDVTVAKYLPRVNFTAGYTWSNNEQFISNTFVVKNELSYYNYGVRASMALDINAFRDVESVKVDYLKAQVVKKDKQRELNELFKQVMHNIENFDKKIALSNDNKNLYSKLLEDTNELYKAGYKTEYDVKTLENSLDMQAIDTKIYEIDKQLELLTLYEMYVNEI
ncbi:transporter [Sulfurimonas aquatica]|uniref:Transporter n=1 Tax=Sulfurimonas aquatica TaxID=2672570 RepID=A0A975AZR5_9BACT|nr:TolC family protein [Sulfurimonas aquatica]QSZ41584.1 transporter [Sulfurimonas aquatica]